MFKLRPLGLYHRELAAWAEWAGRRSCPGKDLSWTIVRAFLLELQAVGWRHEAEDPAAEQEGGARVPTTGYAFAAFDIKLVSKNKKEA